MKKIGYKKIIFTTVIILSGVLGILAYQNRIFLTDWISGLSYSATPELSETENNLALTDSAKLILHASHPVLESRDDFNSHCDSHDEQLSVLGCYSNGKIFLYDIDEEELAGVKESTMAHELLHAVWERLPASEKNTLSAQLAAVYNDEKHHAQLAEDLEIYDESERIDELHSRVGTEITDLPSELESHYAKYFKNQDLVVDFYESYITPFKELTEELDRLSEQLQSLNDTIEQKTQSYLSIANQLSKDIDEFNNCARTLGCFATDYLFNVSRSALVSRQNNIEDLYEELNKLVEEYNKLVEEYNEDVLRGETLESIINSNTKVEKLN